MMDLATWCFRKEREREEANKIRFETLKRERSVCVRKIVTGIGNTILSTELDFQLAINLETGRH